MRPGRSCGWTSLQVSGARHAAAVLVHTRCRLVVLEPVCATSMPSVLCADTGDGGNPTYTVARALASPQLNIRVPPALAHQVSALQQGPEDKQQGEEGQQQQPPQWMTLPRGDVLLLGGDLAYPNPTK
jgi:hypothetical protein